MKKIDRLGWAEGLAFESFGARIGVRVNDPRLLDALYAYLPPGWKRVKASVVERLYSIIVGGESNRPAARRFNLLYGDHVRLARTLDAAELYERFESDLQLYVAQAARRRVFVHAGVVGWEGRAVLVPGRSFSGKTTLVAELVKAGATYYSDEFAVLDARGRVHPYAKPLSVREGGAGRQVKVSVESLGGESAVGPLPVGLVVIGEYRGGARWRPSALSMGRGSLAILEHAVPARAKPAEVMETLARVVAGALVLRGARGEAAEVAPKILERVSRMAAA